MGTLTTSLKRRIRSVMVWTAVGCGVLPNMGLAQTPPFVLEWQKRNASTTKAPGTDYTWNNDNNPPTYTGTPRTTGVTQTLDESGADWWHSVIPIMQGGNHVGYVAVGYTSFVNWGVSDGCYTYGISGYPSTVFNQRFDRRRGAIRNAVAKFDLAGNLVWYRNYFMESLYDVIQDGNGDLVVTGDAGNSVPLTDMNQSIALNHNPTQSNPNQTLPNANCTGAQRHCLVMKLDLNGDVIWHSIYSPMDVPSPYSLTQLLQRRSSGQSIVATNFGGSPGYKIVGFGGLTGPEDIFMLDIDQNGLVLNKQLVTTFPTATWGNNTAAAGFSRALHLAHTTIAGVEHYSMTGFRKALNSTTYSDGFLWVFNDQGSLFFKDTRQHSSEVGSNTSLEHVSSSSCFTTVGGSPRVIWGVLSDHTTDGTTYTPNLTFVVLPKNWTVS